MRFSGNRSNTANHPEFINYLPSKPGSHSPIARRKYPLNSLFTSAKAFFAEGGKGLNCTVPLKELAWDFADHNTERAQLSKAVNTLALQADGSILGDNTDGHGLITDLITNHAIVLSGIRILILGAGGATRGIISSDS